MHSERLPLTWKHVHIGISVFGFVDLENAKVVGRTAMDSAVQLVKLNLQTSQTNYFINSTQPLVLLSQVPSCYFCHTALNGLKESIMDEDVLRLQVDA